MSLRGSVVVILVFAVRFLLRGLPGKYRCALWSAALLAFLLPPALQVGVSVPPQMAELGQYIAGRQETSASPAGMVLPGETQYDTAQAVDTQAPGAMWSAAGLPLPGVSEDMTEARIPGAMWSVAGLSLPGMSEYMAETQMLGRMWDKAGLSLPGMPQDTAEAQMPGQVQSEMGVRERITSFAAALWMLGIIFILAVQFVCYAAMKRRLRTSVCVGGRVYESDRIASPVLFGVFRPCIYLPHGLDEETASYAILHEQMHFRRGDAVRKPFVFLVCTLYWWNPLVWLMYRACGQDMERGCDEAVLERRGTQPVRYAQSLLNAERHRGALICGLTFSSGDTKLRVKNILHFRKAGAGKQIVGCALTAALFAAAVLSPQAEEQAAASNSQIEEQAADGIGQTVRQTASGNLQTGRQDMTGIVQTQEQAAASNPQIEKQSVDGIGQAENQTENSNSQTAEQSVDASDDAAQAENVTAAEVWEEYAAAYPDMPSYLTDEYTETVLWGEQSVFRVRILGEHVWDNEEGGPDFIRNEGTFFQELFRQSPRIQKIIIGWREILNPELYPIDKTCSVIWSEAVRPKHMVEIISDGESEWVSVDEWLE